MLVPKDSGEASGRPHVPVASVVAASGGRSSASALVPGAQQMTAAARWERVVMEITKIIIKGHSVLAARGSSELKVPSGD